jgi:hypothetical protein
MKELKKFRVSCFNDATNEIIYHDVEVQAEHSVHAKRIADDKKRNFLSGQPAGTQFRYVISPVEGDQV